MKDPYLYPGSEILINKFDIKDERILNKLEADFVSSRLKDVIQRGIEGDYDFKHLIRFHYAIFQDIYYWAGEIRTIDIEKAEPALGGISIEYSHKDNIKADIVKVLSEAKEINWDKLSLEEKAKTFSRFMADLWRIHPFREGNTRTIVTFCCYYAEQKGFSLNTDLLKDNSDYVRNALVAASAVFHDLGDRSNLDFLIKIIKDAIMTGRIEGND